MSKEEIVSFETAKLAREKGLDKFNGEDFLVLAPTQSLLQKWLREEHNIWINILPECYSYGLQINMAILCVEMDGEKAKSTHKSTGWWGDNGEYPTYEDALEDGLQQALKLIEKP